MLYYLFEYLHRLGVPGAGAFLYISTRMALAALFSLIITFAAGGKIIRFLQRKQIGDTTRNLGIEGQIKKIGTPTMGGVIIILATLLPSLLFGKLNNVYLWLLILTTVWLGCLGFMDDYIKVFKKNKEGMSPKGKLVGQIVLGITIGIVLYLSPQVVIQRNIQKVQQDETTEIVYLKERIKSTDTTIPFVKNNNFNYSWFVSFMGDYAEACGWGIFALMVILVIAAVSNGVNVTDGLDGLAAGTSSIVGLVLMLLAYLGSHLPFASYLNIMFIPQSEEIVVFLSAFTGATIGFLWYNSYPAQVFMGDVGSLTIGGIIGVTALLIHKELLLPLLCGIFFVESLSVILQYSYFKFTKKKYGHGVRIFKMAPLHHHFQKAAGEVKSLIQKPTQAICESKIVARFWLISLLLAVLTLITLKLR